MSFGGTWEIVRLASDHWGLGVATGRHGVADFRILLSSPYSGQLSLYWRIQS